MGFLAHKVEHQCTKLKVAGSSPAEVCFFLKMLYSDKPGQAGFGCPITERKFESERWLDLVYDNCSYVIKSKA